MSYHLSSRDHEITLADAIAALPTAGLSPRRQQEIASALRCICRALDRTPDRIPAEPRHLSARLKEIAPHAIGISPPPVEQHPFADTHWTSLGAADVARPAHQQAVPKLGSSVAPVAVPVGEDNAIAFYPVLFRLPGWSLRQSAN